MQMILMCKFADFKFANENSENIHHKNSIFMAVFPICICAHFKSAHQ
jgi:hypothetical protein